MLWPQVIVLVISLACALGEVKQEYDSKRGVSLTLLCPTKRIISIVKAEIKEDWQNPIKGDRNKKAFEQLSKDKAPAVKHKCQYLNTCNFKDTTGIKNVLYRVEYECVSTGCPHASFVQKHVFRFDTFDGKTSTLNSMAGSIEQQQRGWLGRAGTDAMTLFWDSPRIEFIPVGSGQCTFRNKAKGFQCRKTGTSWSCDSIGDLKAVFTTDTGHYDAPKLKVKTHGAA